VHRFGEGSLARPDGDLERLHAVADGDDEEKTA
jgi:hypothetical protein